MQTIAAQTLPSRVLFQGSQVLDGGGNAPLVAGQICVQTTDASDRPMGYRVGADAGQTSASPRTSACGAVANGVFAGFSVINSAASNPLNACLRVTTFDSSGEEIRRSKCVQTGTAAALASWCSADGSGNVTCTWDKYPVGTTPLALVQVGPMGPRGYTGCVLNQTCSADLTPNSVTANKGSFSSLNGVVNASVFPGSDLGAQVAAALASLNGACGMVTIATGTYTWSTPITKLPCQTLEGNGSLVNVPAMSGPFLQSVWTPPVPAGNLTLVNGGVNNITFVGPGPNSDVTGANWTAALQSQQGIYLGGSDTNHIGWTENFFNLHVRHFGCGVAIGNGTQYAFFGGVVEDNFDGVCFPLAGVGRENINFHGTQILNNIRWGINNPDNTGLAELELLACSIDYNGQLYTQNGGGGQIHQGTGALHIFGGHMESRQHPFVVMTGGPLVMANTQMISVMANGSGTVPSYIQVGGDNATVDIQNTFTDLTPFGGSGAYATIPSLLDFTSTGAESNVFIRDYRHSILGSQRVMPIFKTGQSASYYRIPHYNVLGDNIGEDTNLHQYPVQAEGLYVNGGVEPGSGMQHVRFAGNCLAPGSGGTCTTAAQTWPIGFPDTNYTLACTLDTPTGVPAISSTTKSSDGKTFTVTIASLTGASSGGNVNCVAMHD